MAKFVAAHSGFYTNQMVWPQFDTCPFYDGYDDDDDDDNDDDDDDDDDVDDGDDENDDDDDDEPKSCFKIAQNRVCCSLGYIFRYIGTPNFSEKVLWVYSHLKSEFF